MSSPLVLNERHVEQQQACDSSDEHGADSDCVAQTNGARLGHAERKRELERNRRNLINTRFAELGTELRRSENDGVNDESKDSARVKRPRMDKEALLKEATMRLLVQHKELTAASARLKDLLSQIDAMRTEMADLRKDKCVLRNEMQRLRSSNTNLWNIIHQSQYPKLSALLDPTKLAADIFAPTTSETEVQECMVLGSGSETGLDNTNMRWIPGAEHEAGGEDGVMTSTGFQYGLPLPPSQQQVPVSGVNQSTNMGGATMGAPTAQREQLQGGSNAFLFASFDNRQPGFMNALPARLPKHHSTTLNMAHSTALGFRPPVSSLPAVSQSLPPDDEASYGSGNSEFTG